MRPEWTNLIHLPTILLLLVSLLCSSCSTVNYIADQIPGQFDLINKHTPVEDLIKNPDTPETMRRELKLTQMAKEYGERIIGLKRSKNYTRFKQLNRDYVVMLLTAAPEFQLEAYTWSFPLFGSFPYLGFFSMDDLKEEQAKRIKEGFDTYVRKVPAFSTTGWFRDPILSTMMGDIPELIETIIHELTHVTIYHKDEAVFNENLANYIGIQGSIEFFQQLPETEYPEKNQWIKNQHDQLKRAAIIGEWVKESREKLSTIYNNTALSLDQKRNSKQKIFKEIQDKWLTSISSRPPSSLNNALLVAFGTYTDSFSQFDAKKKELGSLSKLLEWARNPDMIATFSPRPK